MVRAAAKNHPSVAIVTSPGRYADVLAAVAAGGFTLGRAAAAGRRGVRAHRDVRRRRRVLDGQRAHRHLRRHRLPGLGRRDLGQGGGAALRREPAPAGRALPRRLRRRRPGRRPSSCTARRCPTTTTSTPTPPAARRTTSPSPRVAIIKHANPCGIAVGADVAEAHRKAHACDPVSAFGGVIAANRPVSVAMAEQVAEVFTEVIVAPGVRRRRGRGPARARRTSGSWCARRRAPGRRVETRPITGGAADAAASTTSTPRATTRRPGRSRPARRPRPSVLADLAFAWQACRAVKSNAILLAKDGASVGVGMGQVNRVDSCRLAVDAGGGAGRRLGRRLRRVLPVRGRPADPDRRRRRRDRPARRLGARRADHRGRQGRRRDDVLHRHPALLPLSQASHGAGSTT